jgi:hypothetical protein
MEGASVSSGLIRWCGLAAMLGGVLWVLWAAGQLQGWGGGGGDPGSASYERYEFFNRLLPLVLLPVLVGFVGLYVAQRGRQGWLGTVGLAIVLVGFAVIIAGSVGEFWLFSDQPYAQPNGRNASWTLFLLGHPVLAVGTALLGAATARSRTFPGETGMLFAILCTCGALVPFIGVFILAGPFVWLGYLLWSGKYVGGQQPSRVT